MAKIPEKLYITAKAQHEYDDQLKRNVIKGLPFGFLNAYEPGKAAFNKKKDTQWQWAYARWAVQQIERNGIWYYVGEETDWDYHTQTQTKRLVDEPFFFQPQVWDNVPTRGFQILKSVSRYSTSNKLWRIADPRGVEFEISTGCLEEMMDHTAILKGGHIDEACVWVSNKSLKVV